MGGEFHFVSIGIVAPNDRSTENSFSDAPESSVLKIQMWRHHTIIKNECVGGSKETIKSLLKQGPTGSSRLGMLPVIS